MKHSLLQVVTAESVRCTKSWNKRVKLWRRNPNT